MVLNSRQTIRRAAILTRLTGVLSVALTLLLFALPSLARAVPVYDPGLDWRELETTHLRIYYPRRLSLYAREVSRAAESARTRLAEAYSLDPGRTSITLWDTSEWANGAALAARNQVTLYGTTDRILLRGTHPWVWNVSTHEFSHIFSLWNARFLPPGIAGVAGGALLRRDRLTSSDTAAGNGNFAKGGVSFYLSSESVPRWFAEGIAQFDAELAGFDGFDSIRSMLLRSALLAEAEIPWTGLETTTGKSQIGAELIYNEGFAFVRWLAATHGEAQLIRLARYPGDHHTVLFNHGFKAVFGQSGEELFSQFLTEQKSNLTRLKTNREQQLPGADWFRLGRYTRMVVPAADGRIAVLGSGSSEYDEGILYVSRNPVPTAAHPVTDSFREIADGLHGRPAWAPDGSLWYCAEGHSDFRGYQFADLHQQSWTASGKPDRNRIIRKALRCTDLAFTPSGDLIAAVVQDNTRNLVRLSAASLTQTSDWDKDAADKSLSLTHLLPPAAAEMPTVLADGTVLFTLATTHETDLAWVTVGALTTSTEGALLQPRLQRLNWSGSSERDAFEFHNQLWFVSDRDGAIFDLWSTPWPLTATGVAVRHTAVQTALFHPTAISDTLLVTGYRHEQFAPLLLTASTMPAIHAAAPVPEQVYTQPIAETVVVLNDTRAHLHWTRPLVVPEILYEYEDFKAGLALVLSDERGLWQGELEVLAGSDADVSFAGSYNGWYLPLQVRYDYYRRHRSIPLFDGFKYRLRSAYQAAGIGTEMEFGKDMRLYADFNVSQYDLLFPNPEPLRWQNLNGMLQYYWSNVPGSPDADVNPRGGSLFSSRAKLARSFPTDNLYPGYGIVDYGVLGFTVRNYLLLGPRFTLESGGQVDGLLGWNPGTHRPIAPPVPSLDQLFLGGEFFSLRRGIFQTYKGFAGYDEFAVSGNWLGIIDLTLRWEMARRLFSWGPFYLDGLYLEANSGIGRVWDEKLRWVPLRQQLLHGSFWIDPASLVERDSQALQSRTEALRHDLGLMAESSLALRAKVVLWGSFPWNSYVKIARGWQDPALLGYYYDGTTGTVIKGDAPLFPVRLYIGVGTGF